MEYIVTGICVAVVLAVCVTVFIKRKMAVMNQVTADEKIIPSAVELMDDSVREPVIQIEMLPAGTIPDESKLVEITDSKVLAHVNSLIPGLAQAANAANNAVLAARASGEVLYRAIIPAGAKLAASKNMENAFRGIYHGADGIKGHANLVQADSQKGNAVAGNTAAAAMSVASMIVGQYYMTQIHTELSAIGDGVSRISDFQDNEYRSKVFSLVAHVRKIADFQAEILENDELRKSKITQLDFLEERCTQLLGQADLTLAGYAEKNGLDYNTYEKELKEAQNWYMYQKSLLDVLYRISELKYTLHMGAVSRELCGELLLVCSQQVTDTRERLMKWHQDTMKRLEISLEETRRKRDGLDGVVHFLPGLFRDEYNFRPIEKSIAGMIEVQAFGNEKAHHQDTTDLYAEDVQLIAKDGRVYYFPESRAE